MIISDPGDDPDDPQLPLTRETEKLKKGAVDNIAPTVHNCFNLSGDGSIASTLFGAPDFDATVRTEMQIDAWPQGTREVTMASMANADADEIDDAAEVTVNESEDDKDVNWSSCDPAQLHAKLRSLFHLNRHKVCESVGFSSTTFKIRCRELGISRWPARKLQSIQVYHASLVVLRDAVAADLHTADAEIIAAYIRDLDALKERIYIFPDHPIPSFVRQMADVKRELKRTNMQKRQHDHPES